MFSTSFNETYIPNTETFIANNIYKIESGFYSQTGIDALSEKHKHNPEILNFIKNAVEANKREAVNVNSN
jgi:hypothetical protein